MNHTLTFRAGAPEDQDQIREMTKDIWGGDDYLPHVWNDWVQEAHSHLRVAVLGDDIVASGRIHELSPGYWWLEGLRVHPAHQGKGYATPLHNHLVALALAQPGVRHIALSTDWDNAKVAHLSQASGMRLIAQHRFFRGEGLEQGEPAVIVEQGLTAEEVYAQMMASEWLQRTEGYLMWGWVAYPITLEWVANIIKTGLVLRCGDALALTGANSRGVQAWLYWFGGGSEDEQVQLIRHARHLVPRWRQYEGALRCFTAPLEPLYRAVLAAGMHDAMDDEAFYLNHFVRTLS